MRIVRTVSLWMLCSAVALVGVPGLAAAQNAVLYEVTETMKITSGRGQGSRSATATLMGTVDAGTSICPAWLGVPRCSVVAYANDTLSLVTGKGPVAGRFAVVIQGDNPVDGPELVLVRGQLKGTIDLSPALLANLPFGTLSGEWSARGQKGTPLEGVRVSGTLSGAFRLPFVYGIPDGCLDSGDPLKCLWVSNPSYWVGKGPVDLQSREYSLDVPTVRLEMTFTETSSDSSRSDD